MGLKRIGENWFIDYYADGRRVREKVGPSKSFAKEVYLKRKAEIAEKRFFPDRQSQSMSFAEFCDLYWERHWQYLKAKAKNSIRSALKAEFGKMALPSISCGAIQDFYNAKKTATSAATANRYLARLSHMFARARKWGYLKGANPAADVEKGREESHKIRFLSSEEMRDLLQKADIRLYPILVCALHTGMRRGEILGLRWENINFAQRVIYVQRSKRGRLGEIPMTNQLAEVLKGLGPKDNGMVFRISLSTVLRCFRRALEAAKITEFRFHDLRHTFASHYVMKTSDLPALQQLLGHSTLKMTQRYAHLSKQHLATGMELFSKSIPAVRRPRIDKPGHYSYSR